MNREIKFRIYSEIRNMMLYSDEAPTLSQFFMGKELAEELGQPIVLMQSTGLKDKNGKDIYEGDVVKVYDQEMRTVEFKNAFWQLTDIIESNVLGGFGTQVEGAHKPLYRYHEHNIEVIGNIYENQEILKNETT